FGVKVPVKWPYTEIFHNIPYANHRCRRHLEQIASLQRIKDNEQDFVPAQDMLRELMSDNKAMIESMRSAHEVPDAHDDVATASLLENFIDEAEKRCWFLFEATRGEGEKAKA